MNKLFATLIEHSNVDEAIKLFDSFPSALLDDEEIIARDFIKSFHSKYAKLPSKEFLLSDERFESFDFFKPSTDPIGAVFDSTLEAKRVAILRSISLEINDNLITGKPVVPLIEKLNYIKDLSAERALSIRDFEFVFDPLKVGVKTGIQTIDNDIGHLGKGETMIGVARPNVGKTNWLVNILLNNFEAGKRILFVSAEQPNDVIIAKMIGMKINFPPGLLRKFEDSTLFTESQRDQVADALKWFKSQQDLFFSKGVPSINDISGLISRYDPEVVLVNAIYRLRNSDYKKDIYQHAAGIASSFVELAREKNVPIIGTTQLSRAGDNDAPTGSDIALSDKFMTDPDCVFALNRDGGNRYRLNMTTIKNRLGTADLRCAFDVSPISLRFKEC